MTVLLVNGRIYTLDGPGTVVDTLVVRDGRVVFAGRRDDVNASAAEPVLDLGGRAVLPGLVDAHAHLAVSARSRLALDVGPFGSEDDVARAIGQAARRLGPGGWISGRGWDQTRWPEARCPTKDSLDRVAPLNPVALVRVDGHATWINSAALVAAEVTGETRDPAGGIITRSEDGEPAGILIDAAQELIRRAVPLPTPDQFDVSVREVISECLRKGLTGIHEMGADLEPGKRADLVVLSDDVFTCAEDGIKDITPVATIVSGQVVAGSLAPPR